MTASDPDSLAHSLARLVDLLLCLIVAADRSTAMLLCILSMQSRSTRPMPGCAPSLQASHAVVRSIAKQETRLRHSQAAGQTARPR
jgi:hypothetical protein